MLKENPTEFVSPMEVFKLLLSQIEGIRRVFVFIKDLKGLIVSIEELNRLILYIVRL